jgi:hypothetical protein
MQVDEAKPGAGLGIGLADVDVFDFKRHILGVSRTAPPLLPPPSSLHPVPDVLSVCCAVAVAYISHFGDSATAV